MPTVTTLPTTGFIRIRDLCSSKGRTGQTRAYTTKDGQTRTYRTGQQEPRQGLLGVGESTLRDWIKQGRFPAPIKLSPTVSVWRVEEVRAWMEQQTHQGGQA
jgi:predicted DNA-binding transcriptional regulator AlpA